MLAELSPVLSRLLSELGPLEQEIGKRKSLINSLGKAFGQPPMFPELEDGASITTMQPGQFRGQPLVACVRAILEMKGSPVTVEELYAKLKQGGFTFEAKKDENAKNGIGVSLCKNRDFHKISPGKWGLLNWYQLDKQGRPKRNKINGQPKLKTGPKPRTAG